MGLSPGAKPSLKLRPSTPRTWAAEAEFRTNPFCAGIFARTACQIFSRIDCRGFFLYARLAVAGGGDPGVLRRWFSLRAVIRFAEATATGHPPPQVAWPARPAVAPYRLEARLISRSPHRASLVRDSGSP